MCLDFHINIHEDRPQIREINHQTTYNTIIKDKIWLIFSNTKTVFRIFLTLTKTKR
jgi:hypothetical protein